MVLQTSTNFLKRESLPTASDEDGVAIRGEADNPQLEQCDTQTIRHSTSY